MTAPNPSATDPAITPPAAQDNTPAQIARDAAVRALQVALEHRFPAVASQDLETCAARAVDVFLTVGQLSWTILVEHVTDDQRRLADAVLRCGPDYDRVRGPHPEALRDAATVIRTLIHER